MSVLSNLDILVNEVRDILIKDGLTGGCLGNYLERLEDSEIKFLYYHFKKEGLGLGLISERKLANCLDYQFYTRKILR